MVIGVFPIFFCGPRLVMHLQHTRCYIGQWRNLEKASVRPALVNLLREGKGVTQSENMQNTTDVGWLDYDL